MNVIEALTLIGVIALAFNHSGGARPHHVIRPATGVTWQIIFPLLANYSSLGRAENIDGLRLRKIISQTLEE